MIHQLPLTGLSELKRSDLTNFLATNSIPYAENVSLKKYTTFLTGGNADILIEPQNEKQTCTINWFLSERKIDYFLLGHGSNICLADGFLPGVFLKLPVSTSYRIIDHKNSSSSVIVEVDAGNRAMPLARKISAAGLSGLEFLSTIPGSIGGAIVQNAGCYGHEIKDSLINAIICDNGTVKVFKNESLKFEYRSSLFKKEKHLIIIKAQFALNQTSSQETGKLIQEFTQRRLATQPRNRRSAGSLFKNPTGKSAWKLIEAAGLRGETSGDAQISPEHCNFFVNKKNATSRQIFQLVKKTIHRVKEVTGIELETEVLFIGDFDP